MYTRAVRAGFKAIAAAAAAVAFRPARVRSSWSSSTRVRPDTQQCGRHTNARATDTLTTGPFGARNASWPTGARLVIVVVARRVRAHRDRRHPVRRRRTREGPFDGSTGERESEWRTSLSGATIKRVINGFVSRAVYHAVVVRAIAQSAAKHPP